MVVYLTPQTVAEAVTVLAAHGVELHHGARSMPVGHLHLGLWRRAALAVALQTHPTAELFFCSDLDRALHWAEFYPDELHACLARLGEHDCTVLGRTPRAFASHPRVQRDTETLTNHAFTLASGLAWDMLTATRGLSRRAARLIVEHCDDDTVGSDCSWPLLCRREGLTLGYHETEGMEFETLDRYPDEIAALGGEQAWLDRFDADPRQWLVRLDLARAGVQSTIRYVSPPT